MNGMMSDGGPAFPGASPSTGRGLTTREYIAAQVLGHVAVVARIAGRSERPDELARIAVELTDALMAELRQ